MGKKGGGKSGTYETPISQEQAKILRSRERDVFQDFFFPALRQEFARTAESGARISDAIIGSQAQDVAGQSDALLNTFAQRGLTGGIQATGLASLAAANQQQRRQAVFEGEVERRRSTSGLLGMALQAAPQPTSAVPYGQRTKA